jgi:hypothetical protein
MPNRAKLFDHQSLYALGYYVFKTSLKLRLTLSRLTLTYQMSAHKTE